METGTEIIEEQNKNEEKSIRSGMNEEQKSRTKPGSRVGELDFKRKIKWLRHWETIFNLMKKRWRAMEEKETDQKSKLKNKEKECHREIKKKKQFHGKKKMKVAINSMVKGSVCKKDGYEQYEKVWNGIFSKTWLHFHLFGYEIIQFF